jgi:hypothetical protein
MFVLSFTKNSCGKNRAEHLQFLARRNFVAQCASRKNHGFCSCVTQEHFAMHGSPPTIMRRG